MAIQLSRVGEVTLARAVTAIPAASDPEPVPAPSTRHPFFPGLVSPVVSVAVLVYGWQVQRPGIWRDEAATVTACRRSLADLLALGQNLDLVHLGYYLLARAVWQVDPSVTAVRTISVAAMSLTAGLLVLIGARLGSQRLGVLAGLLLVANPLASRYAQEARPFALVTLLATALSWLLVVLTGSGKPSRMAALGYAIGIPAVAVGNVLALMVVGAHATYLLLGGARTRARAGFWLAAALPGTAVALPFVLLASTQRGQIAWIQRPHLYDLRALASLEFGSRPGPAVVLLAALGLLAARRLLGRPLLPAGPARQALALGATWALLPPAMLFAASLLVPMWDPHYLVFTLPGLALMLAGLVPEVDARSRLRLLAGALPVALIGLLGLGQQAAYRAPGTGHGEDLVAVADLLEQQARPGDAVVFVPAELRILGDVFPQRLRHLDDVAIVSTPLTSGTLTGVPVEPATVLSTLLPHRRVWVVRGSYLPDDALTATEQATVRMVDRYYRPVRTETVTDIGLTLTLRR